MRYVPRNEYTHFIELNNSVTIDDITVGIHKHWTVRNYSPEGFTLEEWTIWDFPQRGDWATHNGDYRGNWSPFIPRNLIQKFTSPGDLVCDPMVGSGTTLVECKLMSRRGIGVDINLNAVMLAMNRLDFEILSSKRESEDEVKLFHGDARNLDKVEDESVDLVATHPPYSNVISYSSMPGDLSRLGLDAFTEEVGRVASECFRVLKPNKHCGILIGDTRRHSHYVPIHIGVLGKFLDAGFVLKEDIIKLQHNTKGARERWTNNSYDFYKIGHEHLYVFRKPMENEETSELRHSKKWW